jgi:hypothetical protein
MTLPLTELNKLIEGATDGVWQCKPVHKECYFKVVVEDDEAVYKLANGLSQRNAEFTASSRTALPNALRVIAECKAGLLDAIAPIDGVVRLDKLRAAYDLCVEFERDVLQQEKM